MHFQFDAYTPEELILASNFLLELAKLQQKRMEQSRLEQANPVYPFEGNLSQPINSVMAGMPRQSYGSSIDPSTGPWTGESG